MIHQVEAGFVTMEQVQLRRGSELAVGGSEAAEVISFGFAGHGAGEEAILDGPGATEAPVGGGHFLDHAELDAVEGAKTGAVLIDQAVEGVADLAGEDDGLGEEAVAEGIEGRLALAFGGNGATGAGAVGAGGTDSS